MTILVAALGLVELTSELLAAGDERSTSGLARSLAFLVVGGPAAAALVRYVDRRLVQRPEESTSPAWTIYLNAALLTTLIATMIEGHSVIRAAIGGGVEGRFEAESLVATVIWSALWVGHWFVLRTRHRVQGDTHLAVGTVVGLVPLGIGLAGVFYVAAHEVYTLVTDDPMAGRNAPSLASWAATAVVGAVTWSWYWLANYRAADRTQLWFVVVVPVGSLAGFVATVAMAASIVYSVAVWFIGHPDAVSAVRHLDSLPALTGVLTAGVLMLVYHQRLLGTEQARSDATRSADYVLSMAAPVTAVIGATLLLAAMMDTGLEATANTLIAGSIMMMVGVPLWLWFWAGIKRHIVLDPTAELRSPLRRIYLFSLFGIGGLAVLIAVLMVLTSGFQDVLDGTVSRATLHNNRIGLSVILSVTGSAWYHFGVYRSERAEYGPATDPPPRDLSVHTRSGSSWSRPTTRIYPKGWPTPPGHRSLAGIAPIPNSPRRSTLQFSAS